ncbi:phage shock protein [Marinomonas sp. S3726]|uniref:PspC domain-containing protein n=1 Tax=Marinomonas sp. S3726 TaxID=579484 RepID=UPI0005FA7AC1|nr:PspC domain-containing protein [Marinomonas sp. S3726]KJZ14215.1 phage shock protein [Marinomonas sp. S3726]
MNKHKLKNLCQKMFNENKQKGWNMNLYRNPDKGYVGGVCAGLADHFDIEPWVVRISFFAGFLFLGGFTLFAYIVLWHILKPGGGELKYEYDERRHQYGPKKMFKYSDSSSIRLKRARDRMNQASRRIEEMEKYVTSKKYDLDREFSSMKDK